MPLTRKLKNMKFLPLKYGGQRYMSTNINTNKESFCAFVKKFDLSKNESDRTELLRYGRLQNLYRHDKVTLRLGPGFFGSSVILDLIDKQYTKMYPTKINYRNYRINCVWSYLMFFIKFMGISYTIDLWETNNIYKKQREKQYESNSYTGSGGTCNM